MEMLVRRHEAQKRAMLKYYHKNREAIAEQRSQKWKEEHPNPRPRGRPRKGGGGGAEVKTDSSESV